MVAFVEKDRLVKDIEKAIEDCDGYYIGTGCPLSKLLNDIEDGLYDRSGG